ncbi:MAG: peptidase S8/S53 domain-containing protein [Monoraphidium minutum]|nr:MAG: peptidase S8/S53 domain-containing protein [Monoraphidium minutum]
MVGASRPGSASRLAQAGGPSPAAPAAAAAMAAPRADRRRPPPWRGALLAALVMQLLARCHAADPADGAAEARAALQARGAARVIVSFRAPPPSAAAATALDGGGGAPGARAMAARLEAQSGAKARALSRARAAAGGGAALARDYASLPLAALEVTSDAALAALAGDPDVVSIAPERRHRAQVVESGQLVSAPAAHARGWKGKGCVVAVLDSGADFTHADLGRCARAGPGCPVVWAGDFTPRSDFQRDDGSGHGTNVASIVLKIAPEAEIMACDVFDGRWAYESDILAAIDMAVASKLNGTLNICAINLSLGGGKSSKPCYKDPYEAAFQVAKEAGIVVTAASGNENHRNALTKPACAPSAVSVGAVYDADVGPEKWSNPTCTDATTYADASVCFSNSASFLTMVAPGAYVTAGGRTMAGTSQAAPHVAGAAAVLKALRPSATWVDVVYALTSAGRPNTDRRSGHTRPRLDVYAAAEALANGSAPVGRVTVALPGGGGGGSSSSRGGGESSGGGATATKKVDLIVTLGAAAALASILPDFRACAASGPPPLAAAAAACRKWGKVTAGKPLKHSLAVPKDYQGPVAVVVFFKTEVSSDFAPSEGEIIFDSIKPTMDAATAALAAAPAPGGLNVSFIAAADDGAAGSGVARFALAGRKGGPPRCPKPGGKPPPVFVEFAAAPGPRPVSALVAGPAPGERWGFSACAYDRAGNAASPSPELKVEV